MPKILCIETATTVCSVALIDGSRVVSYREISEGYKHAEMITLFISEVLVEAGLSLSDLDAVAVSSGPGSYTGLRIGMSTAKGICFASDLPLISISTLEIMTAQAIHEIDQADEMSLFCPMIDARRMEVYCALFDRQFSCVQPVSAIVVTDDFYYAESLSRKVFYFGDGAEKCSSMLKGNFIFHVGVYPSAKFMMLPALNRFANKQFENTALVEPFYLKEFQPGKK